MKPIPDRIIILDDSENNARRMAQVMGDLSWMSEPNKLREEWEWLGLGREEITRIRTALSEVHEAVHQYAVENPYQFSEKLSVHVIRKRAQVKAALEEARRQEDAMVFMDFDYSYYYQPDDEELETQFEALPDDWKRSVVGYPKYSVRGGLVFLYYFSPSLESPRRIVCPATFHKIENDGLLLSLVNREAMCRRASLHMPDGFALAACNALDHWANLYWPESSRTYTELKQKDDLRSRTRPTEEPGAHQRPASLGRVFPGQTQVLGRVKAMPEKKTSRDWLGAAAEMAKSLPGGGVVLAPLVKLREDEKAETRNKAIDEMFAQNRELTEQSIAKAIEIQNDSRDVKAMLHVLKLFLVEIRDSLECDREKQSGMKVVRADLTVTKFPLPIPKELLKEELSVMFKDSESFKEFRDCLEHSGLPSPDDRDRTKAISSFVEGIPGRNLVKLADAFQRLHCEREESRILQFAAEYLIGSLSAEP